MACALPMLAAAGCTDDRVLADDGSSSDTTPSTGSTATAGPSSGPVDPSSSSSGGSTTAVDDGTSLGTTGGPPLEDMGGGGPYDCDPFAQDCPAGHKCMPWDGGRGGTWTTWGCKPLDDDPVGAGEPCHVERSPYSGLDDCELGAMCWDVDRVTLEGTCVDFCVGTSEADAYCEDPGTLCEVSTSGPFLMCTPVCDPIAQDCPAGEGCYFVTTLWECMGDASGDTGAYGDACEFINVCDPGLVCAGSEAVPPGLPCQDEIGCCTEVCDLSLGDMQCAGAADGQICVPWYDEGEAPAGLENVGTCALPQ